MERGGNVGSGLEIVMLDGMMCFDDETTCQMVTLVREGTFVTVCELQAFFFSMMNVIRSDDACQTGHHQGGKPYRY